MAEPIQMIALSPTMEEGVIGKWTKKVGDKIATGDVICEVETDKAVMDYESSQEGTLLKILTGDGVGAKVGDVIAVIGAAGEDITAFLAKLPAGGAAAKSAATPVAATAQAPAAAAPASPANVAAPSAAAPSAAPPANSAAHEATPGTSGAGIASPLARKLAADKGFDINSIPGSGPGGRVVKRDIEGYKPPAAGARPAAAAGTPGAGAASSFGTFAPAVAAGQDISIPVTGTRAIIAKRLSESLFTAPHFYLKNSVKMDTLMAARGMLNKEVPANAKVSFNAFIIKLVAEALKRHPAVNASWKGDSILQFGSVDVGLAVDLGNGLITPIVRNAGNKGVVQIDQELKVLIEKAGNNRLKPDEYTGATFTISNLGSFGVEEFTAIINPPGSAILALGEVKKTPVVGDDDSIGIASIMQMTLSCDHRVIDGATGARFIKELSSMIENPVRVIF